MDRLDTFCAPRRLVLVLVAATALLTACRPGEVEVVLGAGQDGSYAYRYDIETTVTRTVDGVAEPARRTESVLLVNQRVVGTDDQGRIRAEVALVRDGGAVQRALVHLDRAGSLAAIEQLDGVPADDLGLGGLDRLLLAEAIAPPGRLRPGQTWLIDQPLPAGPGGTGSRRGSGRLDHLAMTGGHRTAVVTTDLSATIGSRLDVGPSSAGVQADQRSVGTTAYDLLDGAVRWARVRTTGAATVTIDPPTGTAGPPVVAEVDYEVAVRTLRR